VKKEVDAAFLGKTMERATARAKELRDHPHSKKTVEKGRESLRKYKAEGARKLVSA
jgi:hypothetical protein